MDFESRAFRHLILQCLVKKLLTPSQGTYKTSGTVTRVEVKELQARALNRTSVWTQMLHSLGAHLKWKGCQYSTRDFSKCS